MVTYLKFSKDACKPEVKLYGKTVLITGANSGIGLETARDLASRGARIILAVRNMEKGIKAAKDIIETTGNNNLVVRKLDLASIEEVRKFAQQVNDVEEKLDILILNASSFGLTRKYLTENNLEYHMASNHFGHFLLTNLLLPLLCETSIAQRRTLEDPVRIIVVSSMMHWHGKIDLDNLNSERHFQPDRIFSNTKLANLLFAFELSRKLRSEGYINVTVNALHSGPVQTKLLRLIPFHGLLYKVLGGLFPTTHKEGAQTSIFCAVSEKVVQATGKYFVSSKITKSSPDSTDEKLAKALWDKSAQLVDLMPHETVVWN